METVKIILRRDLGKLERHHFTVSNSIHVYQMIWACTWRILAGDVERFHFFFPFMLSHVRHVGLYACIEIPKNELFLTNEIT